MKIDKREVFWLFITGFIGGVMGALIGLLVHLR